MSSKFSISSDWEVNWDECIPYRCTTKKVSVDRLKLGGRKIEKLLNYKEKKIFIENFYREKQFLPYKWEMNLWEKNY